MSELSTISNPPGNRSTMTASETDPPCERAEMDTVTTSPCFTVVTGRPSASRYSRDTSSPCAKASDGGLRSKPCAETSQYRGWEPAGISSAYAAHPGAESVNMPPRSAGADSTGSNPGCMDVQRKEMPEGMFAAPPMSSRARTPRDAERVTYRPPFSTSSSSCASSVRCVSSISGKCRARTDARNA